MRVLSFPAMCVAIAALIGSASAQQPTKITIAVVPSVPSASTFIALDKGYFRDAGLDVTIERVDSLGKAVAFVATNRMQVAQGGINAGYFNSVGQGLPLTLALEGGSTPLYHKFLVRPALKDAIKKPADLKGRTVAVNAPGSVLTYELANVLKAGGLTIKDVTTKTVSFPQMGAALANGALDAAIEVAPFTQRIVEQKIAVPWVDPEDFIQPLPLSNLGYMANTDWIKQHPDLARKLFVALAKGGREYCQAYHHGPNRAEVVDILLKNNIVKDRALLERMDWQARDPDGTFNVASLMSIQAFFKSQGILDKEVPAAQLVDTSFAAAAAKELGPFQVINKDSKLRGCR